MKISISRKLLRVGLMAITLSIVSSWATVPTSAATTSYVLELDPAYSNGYMSGGFIGATQSFVLSGLLKATVTDGTGIQLTSMGVVATMLPSTQMFYPPGTVVPFSEFPTFPGTYNGLSFSGTSGPGSLSVGSYSGTFDGNLLVMSGKALQLFPDGISTYYSMRAKLIPCPRVDYAWQVPASRIMLVFGLALNGATQVVIDGISSSLIQPINDETLLVIIPEGVTLPWRPGTVQVTTQAGCTGSYPRPCAP